MIYYYLFQIIKYENWARLCFSNLFVNKKMKEILKVEETNSESQIVIQAAKHGN